MTRLLLLILVLTACSGGGSGGASPLPPAPQPTVHRGPLPPITHVIVIIQENRTVDDLFQFLPGANTSPYGMNLQNQQVALVPESLTAPYDMQHNHSDWVAAYNGGALNGWNNEVCTKAANCPSNPAYAYVPQSEAQPYYDMAEQYAFADDMFQTNQGPSFPAHQYLVSGTSTIRDGSPLRASENPAGKLEGHGGCDSPPLTRVMTIGLKGVEADRVFPCFDRSSIFTLLDNASVSWRYYQAQSGPGFWNAVDALKPLWSKGEIGSHVVAPSAQVLTDISNGNLASVTFVTPTAKASDHAGVTDGSGPSWVASVVNAVGASQYWNSTAVIVTWDDSGGWFDHFSPPQYNSYELGFRVPLIVISPYAKSGYVSHTQHEFGSILHFIEDEFGLPLLGTTDARSDNLADCFSGSDKARRFHKIRAKYGAEYFMRQPTATTAPDND